MDQEGTVEFDSLVNELQQAVIEQERELYSDQVLEEAYHPKNMGQMEDADAQGATHGWCGDSMSFYLRLDDDTIRKAMFTTDGCGATLACGSMLTKMVTGLDVEAAGEVMPEDLLEALGGLPEESVHCAGVAVAALQNALFNLLALKPRVEEGDVDDD